MPTSLERKNKKEKYLLVVACWMGDVIEYGIPYLTKEIIGVIIKYLLLFVLKVH